MAGELCEYIQNENTLTNFAGMPTNICMEWELYGKGGKLDFFI